jgi:microcystin-dependent protein
MGQPYVGEIRMFGGNFAPCGWLFCDGQLLPISENETLFNLIGTTYGGDGQSTFQLPDLRSRVPIHQGTNAGNTFILAQAAGVENVTLTTQQIPSHNHFVLATATNQQNLATSTSFPATAIPATDSVYGPPGSQPATFAPAILSSTGGSQPHTDIQPFQAINFIISLFGVFPNQN